MIKQLKYINGLLHQMHEHDNEWQVVGDDCDNPSIPGNVAPKVGLTAFPQDPYNPREYIKGLEFALAIVNRASNAPTNTRVNKLINQEIEHCKLIS